MEGDCPHDHGPRIILAGNFYVGKYPITNAEYYNFLQESGYYPTDDSNFLKHWVNGIYLPGDADCPVVYVSMLDAQAYADFYGFRLPFDHEWQLIAAGPEKLIYPWGNTFNHSKVYHSSEFPVIDIQR